jgi:thioredoxin-like negative regulator of GroEL
MSFMRRLRGWFSSDKEEMVIPPTVAFVELLDKARREMYHEAYSQALKLLDEASALVDNNSQKRAAFDLAFSRADVLIALGRFKEAETLLQELRKDCETQQMKAPLAYTLSSLGQLAQKQAQFEQAQTYYEAAR